MMKLAKDRDIVKSNIDLIENFSRVKQEKLMNNVKLNIFIKFLLK